MADITHRELMQILVPLKSLAEVLADTLGGNNEAGFTPVQAADLAAAIAGKLEKACDRAMERAMGEHVPIADVQQLLKAYSKPKPRRSKAVRAIVRDASSGGVGNCA